MSLFVLSEPALQRFVENQNTPLLPFHDNAIIGIAYLIVLSLVVIYSVGRTAWIDGQRALCAFCVVYLPWATGKFAPDALVTGMIITVLFAAAISVFEELLSERLLRRLQNGN